MTSSNGPAALTTEYIFILCLEILPDSQPYVGHGKCGEVGGCSPGKALYVCLCVFLNVCLHTTVSRKHWLTPTALSVLST